MKTRDQPRRTNFRSSSQEQNRSPGEGESSGDLGLPPLPRCIPTSSLIPLSLQPPTSHHLLWKLFPVHLQHHFNSFHSHWPLWMHYYPVLTPTQRRTTTHSPSPTSSPLPCSLCVSKGLLLPPRAARPRGLNAAACLPLGQFHGFGFGFCDKVSCCPSWLLTH